MTGANGVDTSTLNGLLSKINKLEKELKDVKVDRERLQKELDRLREESCKIQEELDKLQK